MKTDQSASVNTHTSSLNFLYFISFIEGGVVMVTELAGARLLAPFLELLYTAGPPPYLLLYWH